MPVTQLDPRTALVVIDLQTGIVGMDGPRAQQRRRTSSPAPSS